MRIFIGLLLGIAVGWLWPSFAMEVRPLADVFLRMIKMIVAPLLFSTLVVGIAGSGDLKSLGRIGLKAIIYFEVATTIALIIGLVLVNVFQPGAGLAVPLGGRHSRSVRDAAGAAARVGPAPAPVPDVGHRRDGARRHPPGGRLRDLLRRRRRVAWCARQTGVRRAWSPPRWPCSRSPATSCGSRQSACLPR